MSARSGEAGRSDEPEGHDRDAPDLPNAPAAAGGTIIWASEVGEGHRFRRVDRDEPLPAPLPVDLFADSFGIAELDAVRDRVRQGLDLDRDLEDDAYLLHNLRSYKAASECGQYIAANISLLKGKRNPRIVYPASARDLSILGLAEQLLEHSDVDEVNLVLTEAYAGEGETGHVKMFEEFLRKYAGIRGDEFSVVEDVFQEGSVPSNFVLTVKGKQINIELKNHKKDDPLASEEELGDCDIIFFHDLDGAYEKISTLRKILTTVHRGMKARSAGEECRVPLLIVDDLPRDIWKWFGNVTFKTGSAYGHRGPRALTAAPGKSAIEVGGPFQRGLIVQPHATILGLSQEAFLRYLSFAFYAYLTTYEPESYEDRARNTLAEKTGFYDMGGSWDGAEDIKAFTEIVDLPQDVLSNERLQTMILPFLRRMERLMTSKLEHDRRPLAYPWPEREDGSVGAKPPLSKRLRDAYEKRRAAAADAIGQLEILLLDFIGPNAGVRSLKNRLQIPLTGNLSFQFANYPKVLLELLDDETFVLFLRTLIIGIVGVIDPSVQDKNPSIFPPKVMSGIACVNSALKRRGMDTLNDKIKEILLMAYFAHRRKKLEKEIHLFDEAPGLMAALNATRQAVREHLKGKA